ALRALGEGSRPGETCPPPERLWATLARELPPEERRDVIDHIAGCASCAEAWRLAVEIHPEPLSTTPSASRTWLVRVFAPTSLVPLAAAAALLLAVGGGLVLVQRPKTSTPGYREAGPSPITSLLSEREPLSREAFRLRWSPGPEGARYDVRVT